MKKILTLLLLIFSSTLHAHFTHFEPRIIHLFQEQQDTIILMRMPLPLILLDEQWKGIDSEQNIPYTRKFNDPDGIDYLLDHAKIRDDINTFKTIISQGYTIQKNTIEQQYLVDAIHIFNTDNRKPFSSLDTALKNFTADLAIQPEAIKLFDAGIDIKLRLPNTSIITDGISIQSVLGDKFNAINRLANIVNLHREDNTPTETTVGILDYSSTQQASYMQKIITGFNDGFIHILLGLDHVVFVLLLFYSAANFLRLLSLATAFTIGHSFSLFFGNGMIVSSPIFTPSIELLIALTIFISAIALLMNKTKHISTTPLLIIGIIHGFGFSFVFNELSMAGSHTSISQLLSFNIGIEAGQIFIYGIAFIITRAIQIKFQLIKPLQYHVSLFAIAISLYWVITRSIPVINHLVS